MGAHGLLGPTIPEEYGGAGLGYVAYGLIARELERSVTVEEVRPLAHAALADVFGLELEPLPADDGHGLWSQPVHAQLAAKS